MTEQTCKACGGTRLAPTRGGVPRGSCHCPENLTRSKEAEMTAEKNTQEAPQAPAPKTPKAPKPIAYEPQGEVRAVKAGTKLALLIDELSREEGTTLDLLAAELSRTGSVVDASGVRSWLSYDLRRAGYGVRQDGERLHLVLPSGISAPLAHKVAEPTKAAPEAPALKVVAEPKAKKAAMGKPKASKKAKAGR